LFGVSHGHREDIALASVRRRQTRLTWEEEIMAFTLDSSLGELLDHPQAKAILDKHIPGVSANPMVAMARGMSLKSILSLPQAAAYGMTTEKVEEILAEVNETA